MKILHPLLSASVTLLHCLFAFTCSVKSRSDTCHCSRTRAMPISYSKALLILGTAALAPHCGRPRRVYSPLTTRHRTVCELNMWQLSFKQSFLEEAFGSVPALVVGTRAMCGDTAGLSYANSCIPFYPKKDFYTNCEQSFTWADSFILPCVEVRLRWWKKIMEIITPFMKNPVQLLRWLVELGFFHLCRRAGPERTYVVKPPPSMLPTRLLVSARQGQANWQREFQYQSVS